MRCIWSIKIDHILDGLGKVHPDIPSFSMFMEDKDHTLEKK